MNHIVYMASKTIIFGETESSGCDAVLALQADEHIDRAKIMQILENINSLCVISPDADRAFADFASQFTAVTACGGVVENARGECLMIFRNGRWDLPKGHLESGETLEQCAAREVCEETGVEVSAVGRKLCETLHCYELRGVWELKRTHWYAMTAQSTELTPQTEEGITVVKWCDAASVARNLQSTYPTIRAVFDSVG